MLDIIHNCIDYFLGLGNIMQAVLGVFSFYGMYSFIRDWQSKKVVFSLGEFNIKRKYFDVQNITNIVSAEYYGGGKVPDNIRKEIIKLTTPDAKNFVHYDKEK